MPRGPRTAHPARLRGRTVAPKAPPGVAPGVLSPAREEEAACGAASTTAPPEPPGRGRPRLAGGISGGSIPPAPLPLVALGRPQPAQAQRRWAGAPPAQEGAEAFAEPPPPRRGRPKR